MSTNNARIISLIPSVTETLFELGLENQIVGITPWCSSPFHFQATKPIIATNEGILFEKIKEQQPTIILVNPDEIDENQIDALSEITQVWQISVRSYEDNLKLIEALGKKFHKNTDAQKWIDKIRFAKQDFDAFIAQQTSQKVAYLLQKNPYISVNKNTYIHAILELNKFTNIYADHSENYPTIEIKKIRIQGDPELVLLPTNIYPFSDEDVFEIGRYTHHGKTIFIEGEMFSWFGVRIYHAFSYFKQIHERIKSGF